MNTFVLSSTPFLTLLLAIGLFFFIRASVKERITCVKFASELKAAELRLRLTAYFAQRAYQPIAGESLAFAGWVRPSRFLAVFLSLLAACGLGCLALVLAFVWPQIGSAFLALVAIAPLAGVFYWRRAGRHEEVRLEIEDSEPASVAVTAHRDEIIQLQRSLPLERVD